MTPSPSRDAALDPADEALIERVAARIVELRLEVPAILTLETSRPLSVLAGQAVYFFEPILGGLLRIADVRRFGQLIERRDAIERLIHRIETRADDAHRERREAKAARRLAGKRPSSGA